MKKMFVLLFELSKLFSSFDKFNEMPLVTAFHKKKFRTQLPWVFQGARGPSSWLKKFDRIFVHEILKSG